MKCVLRIHNQTANLDTRGSIRGMYMNQESVDNSIEVLYLVHWYK